MAEPSFPITGNPDDDQLLIDDPLALVLGMLLDQQVPMEWAFRGPARLKERLGGRLDAADLSARVNALPGFGKEKSMIFIALLGKRFGRSDTRDTLRRFFETDTAHVVVAVLSQLATAGAIETSVVADAIARYGIDPDTAPPWTH